LNTLFYETQQKIEKYIKITTLPISVLTSGKALIALPTGFGAQKNNSIVSYDINNQKTLDGIFLQTENILASQPIDNKINISFSENGLFIWQTNLNKNSEIFNQNLPDKLNFGGLAFYPDTSRVYVIDKNESKVVSLKKTNEKFNDFKISVSDKKLKSAESIAIDGNIYILTNDNILKFTKGIEQKFNLPTLLLPFSGKGKIYTEKNYKNIYVLDIGNNRIIVLNKKAELVGIMSDKSFTNLKDFFVDEKNKTIYLLNDSSLLKVNW
jgi:DNA-binding beta-propeller fold protein YncE